MTPTPAEPVDGKLGHVVRLFQILGDDRCRHISGSSNLFIIIKRKRQLVSHLGARFHKIHLATKPRGEQPALGQVGAPFAQDAPSHRWVE